MCPWLCDMQAVRIYFLLDLAADRPGGTLPHRSAPEEERVGDDDDDARDQREDEAGVLEPDAEHLGDPEGYGRADWDVSATVHVQRRKIL
jgi:hypothetical protein